MSARSKFNKLFISFILAIIITTTSNATTTTS